MNRDEVTMLLGMFQANYPTAYKDSNESILRVIVDTWYFGLKDKDSRLVFSIAQRHIMTDKSGFPPVLAVINEEYHKAINPSAFISAEEAWTTVKKAIKNYGYYRENEALASLSDSAERAVRSIGWQNICMADDKRFDFMKRDFIGAYEDNEKEERLRLIAPKTEEEKAISHELWKNLRLPEEYQKALKNSEENNDLPEM